MCESHIVIILALFSFPKGDSTQASRDQDDSESPPIKTKKLFITGMLTLEFVCMLLV